MKLLRNVPGLQFEGRIHEQVLASLRPHGEIARIDAMVLHSGYDTSVEGQKRKRVRDAKLLKLDLEDRPNHPFVLFNLGMTAHFTGGHEEAIDWLRKSISASQKTESHLRKAFSMMGVSYRELGQNEEALAAFAEGIECVGNDAELRFQQALTYTRLNDFAAAKASYEAMDLDIASHFSSVDIGILTFKRSHNLASVEVALGNYPRGRELYLQAIEQNPSFAPSSTELFEAAFGVGDYATAKTALDYIEKAEGPTVEWTERTARLAEAIGKPGDAFAAVRRETELRPRSPGPALALCRMLLQAGQVAAAEPYLLGLEAAGVAEAAFFLGVARLQQGRIEEALRHTERAVQLNPAHEPSRDQAEKLRTVLDSQPADSVLSPEDQKIVLRGPHVGSLGKPTKRFSVVIVTYNSAKFIGRCLESVLETLGPDDEVIVVENASADTTAKMVAKVKDPRLVLIKNDGNAGYSKAANQGALRSGGNAIVFLNPDTEVYPGWLEGLGSRLELGVGAVGPLADAVAGDQFVGHYLQPGEFSKGADLNAIVADRLRGQSMPTKFLVGMAMMVPRAVLNEFGLLDEGMFLGADDLEFSWRLRRLGLKLIIAQNVFVKHVGHASFATRTNEETSPLIAASDAALLRKLKRFYGENVPSSYRLWGCDIFAEAMQKIS